MRPSRAFAASPRLSTQLRFRFFSPIGQPEPCHASQMPPLAVVLHHGLSQFVGRSVACRPQAQRMSAYDMWSVGVVWLELLLGTPHVFQVSALRGSAQRLHSRGDSDRQFTLAEETERNATGVRQAPVRCQDTTACKLVGPRGPSAVHAPLHKLKQTSSARPAMGSLDAKRSLAPQVSVRTWAVLHHRLRLADKPPQEAATAVLLRGLMELCIYGAAPSPPRGGRGPADSGDGDGEHLPVPWSCTDDALMQVRCCVVSLHSAGFSLRVLRTSIHAPLYCVRLCCNNYPGQGCPQSRLHCRQHRRISPWCGCMTKNTVIAA